MDVSKTTWQLTTCEAPKSTLLYSRGSTGSTAYVGISASLAQSFSTHPLFIDKNKITIKKIVCPNSVVVWWGLLPTSGQGFKWNTKVRHVCLEMLIYRKSIPVLPNKIFHIIDFSPYTPLWKPPNGWSQTTMSDRIALFCQVFSGRRNQPFRF